MATGRHTSQRRRAPGSSCRAGRFPRGPEDMCRGLVGRLAGAHGFLPNRRIVATPEAWHGADRRRSPNFPQRPNLRTSPASEGVPSLQATAFLHFCASAKGHLRSTGRRIHWKRCATSSRAAEQRAGWRTAGRHRRTVAPASGRLPRCAVSGLLKLRWRKEFSAMDHPPQDRNRDSILGCGSLRAARPLRVVPTLLPDA